MDGAGSGEDPSRRRRVCSATVDRVRVVRRERSYAIIAAELHLHPDVLPKQRRCWGGSCSTLRSPARSTGWKCGWERSPFLGAAYCQRLGRARAHGDAGRARFRGRHVAGGCEFLAVTVGFVYVVIIVNHSFKATLCGHGNWGDSTIDVQLVTWPSKLMVPVALSTAGGAAVAEHVGLCADGARPIRT